MKRVFISTDSTLHGIFNNDIAVLQKVNNSNLNLLNTNDIVYYDFANSIFDLTFTTSSIIIVKDSSTTALKNIKEDTDFLLHHSRTEEHQRMVVTPFKGRKKPGMHSNRVEDLYKPILKFLFDDGEDKLNRILGVLGFTDSQVQKENELESKLNFLHHCLTPAGLRKAELKAEWDAETEFDVLAAVKTDGPFGDTYLKSLRTLRDKLLVS